MSVEDLTLNAEPRSVVGRKVKTLRNAGKVPAVVYGGDTAPAHIQVDEREFSRLLARGGAAHLINLTGTELETTRVLVREVQRHPVRRTLLHADFVRVAKGVKIRISVPLTVIGTAPAVAEGAILLQNADSVEIECLPDDLPAEVTVDVSILESVGQQITAGDLDLPEGVTLSSDNLDEVIFATTIPRAVAIEEELEEEAFELEEMVEEEEEEKATE